MTSIREVARQMTAAGANAAIVDLRGGGFGIVTDRDIRTRIVAAGVPLSAPVAGVMTTPVFSVSPGRLGGEVLFELLERGIRHAPVVNERGQLVGVIEDLDLFAVQPRSWFGARRAIARAQSVESLATVAGRLPEIVSDLHAANLRALEVARVLSALVDALTVRAIELAGASLPASRGRTGVGRGRQPGAPRVHAGIVARRARSCAASRRPTAGSRPCPRRWRAAAWRARSLRAADRSGCSRRRR